MAEEKVTKTTKSTTAKTEKKAPAKKVAENKVVEAKAETKKAVAPVVKGKTIKFAKIVQFAATGRRKAEESKTGGFSEKKVRACAESGEAGCIEPLEGIEARLLRCKNRGRSAEFRGSCESGSIRFAFAC